MKLGNKYIYYAIMLCDYFDTITIKLPDIGLLLLIQPTPVAKLSQQCDERGVNTPSKDGNQTGMADLYMVYTITLG